MLKYALKNVNIMKQSTHRVKNSVDFTKIIRYRRSGYENSELLRRYSTVYLKSIIIFQPQQSAKLSIIDIITSAIL